MHKQLETRCRRAIRALLSNLSAVRAVPRRIGWNNRRPSPREACAAGALGAGLVASAPMWPQTAMALAPLYAAFVLGLHLRVPAPRTARMWPPSRLFQWAEWYAVERPADNTATARIVSPYASQAVSGLLHAPVAANLLADMWTRAWWLVVVEATIAWAFFAGTGLGIARWWKLRARKSGV